MSQTYWIETLGCPKNQVDSDKLEGTLLADGMVAAEGPEDADLVVVNTCAFVEEAREESVATILAIDDVRAEGSRLVVSGCMAERYGTELADALPEVDEVSGFGVPVTLDRVDLPADAGGKVFESFYLSAEEIVDIAVKNDVDAIHPGYGFLSENTRFVELCEQAGVTFIGPPSKVIHKFSDKTEARALAIAHNVPVVPGTSEWVTSIKEAREFCDKVGYPVICKAAFGGGGRGMRVVRSADELETNFNSASNEALTAFGNGAMFIERYVDSPRHVEIQIMADGHDTLHLFERDCSVQRRHQKIVEVAPAIGLPADLTQKLYDDAVRLRN
jgi:hypothetical protein